MHYLKVYRSIVSAAGCFLIDKNKNCALSVQENFSNPSGSGHAVNQKADEKVVNSTVLAFFTTEVWTARPCDRGPNTLVCTVH